MANRITRRGFLADSGMGFTGLALGAMLARDGIVKAGVDGDAPGWRPPDGKPHFAPKAKSVIWLFMLGGVSHLESFDPKPALNRYANKSIAETPFKGALDNPLVRKNVREFVGDRRIFQKILPLQVGYRKRGQSGIEVSDWFPHVGGCIDDIAVIRSAWVTDNDHAAQYQVHTGRHIFDGSHPPLGSWVHYGLGAISDDLPSFVAIGDPPGVCCGGLGVQTGSYLGPSHSAVQLGADPKVPLAYSSPGPDVSVQEQEAEFQLLADLNDISAADHPTDERLKARIRSYELAFRMQRSVPEAFGFETEPEPIRRLYGLDNDTTRDFGRSCLMARRLTERGVRFVQVYHGDGWKSLWDAHTDLRQNHEKLCAQVDQPIAALLTDLKQRGQLDETLVVWVTEFGRTPGLEMNPGTNISRNGRDHHPYGFSVWMAGGGIKGGVVHGATDDLGFHAVENRHYITDIHATILHQLGLDPRRLEVPGRKRLEIDFGVPIQEIIA